MRVYEAIVRGLESVGVEAAFGGAGENAAGMMIALKNSKTIRPIMTRHEQAASFMACGYAMFTNKLGVCWATAGPGAFNFFSGLAMAMSDSYPMLAISGYASLDWRGKGSLNETSGLNGTPDSQAMFAATTKKSWLLTDIDDTMDVLEEAVNLAFEGRNRCRIDDNAARAVFALGRFRHPSGGKPHHVEGADQVDADDTFEIGQRQRPLAAEDAPGRADARAIDENTQSVAGASGRLDCQCGIGFVGYVARKGHSADFACQLLGGPVIAVEYVD